MALTRSTAATIFSPEGNSLAVFIDVTDGELKLKDVFGDILPFTEIVGGNGLNLQNEALMTSTLTPIVDKDNTVSALSISTEKTKIESSQQCPLEVESTGVGGGIALLDNTTTNNSSVGIGALGDNLCFRAGGDADGNMRLHSTGNLTLGGDLSDNGKTLDVRGTANITERVTIEADSTATIQSTAVIQATTLNSGIALVPNGIGAITAQVPDGTTVGGNARGNYAVDLQMFRNNANQVASGGSNNGILSGQRNIVSNILAQGSSVISGGDSNTVTSDRGTISGGGNNNVSSNYSNISGGQSNTASTGTHATVVGGQSNVSSGQYSVSGGFTNTASGVRSVAMGDNNRASGARSVAMGNGNTASGNNSVALGGEGSVASGNSSFAIGGSVSASGEYSHVMGFDNVAEASRSFALGGGASAYLTGQLSLSQGKTGSGGAQNGNAQQSLLTAKREDILTTAATTVLSLDGTGTTNLIIPRGVNRAWNVTVKWVAVVTAISGTATGVTVGDYMVETNTFGFKRVGGTSSITAIGTSGTFGDASITGTALMTYTAGASQELSMVFTAPTFVGGGTITMRVVAKVELTETAW